MVAAKNKATLSYKRRESVELLAEEIVTETVTARVLLCLKEELDGLFKQMSREERLLLEYKYFRRKQALKQLKETPFPFSERTYFRKQSALFKRIYNQFALRGWTEEWFLREFSDFRPFMNALKAVEEGKDRAVKRSQNSKSSEGGATDFLPRRTKNATTRAERASAPRNKKVTPDISCESVAGG